MSIKNALIALLLTVSAASVAQAEGSYDILFRTGTLDRLEAGAELDYAQAGSTIEEADTGLQDIGLRITVKNEAETYLDMVSEE